MAGGSAGPGPLAGGSAAISGGRGEWTIDSPAAAKKTTSSKMGKICFIMRFYGL